LITQAHLSPLPVYMTPIYWAFDHALHLYPLPDLIVVCDKFKSITDTIADCTIINPVILLDNSNENNHLFLFV
jgi:DNA polymerase epsilon subunit 2